MTEVLIQKPILTIKEVADYLGYHEATIWRYAKLKQLPFFKVGGRWRARWEDIERMGRI